MPTKLAYGLFKVGAQKQKLCCKRVRATGLENAPVKQVCFSFA
jgi:hypothetical protein